MSMRSVVVRDLNARTLGMKPVNVDWSEASGEYGENFQFFEADHCQNCNAVTTDSECPICGMEMWLEGPMMNYFYPLPGFEYVVGDARKAAEKLMGLPLCIVQFPDNDDDNEWGLALTGGGMDFTWEICEAHMILGYLPPFHFARDLPAMSDRGKRHNDRKIISACRRSLRLQRDTATYALKRLNQQYSRGAT